METRTLGRNGPVVSRLGIGTAAIGRPGYLNLGHGNDYAANGAHTFAAMRQRCVDVLDAARAGGITYVDCARSYGKAEEFCAHWLALRRLSADDVVIGSKWGYTYTAGWAVDTDVHEVKDHAALNMVRQYTATRALLGPWLGLEQIHSATFATGVLRDRDVCARMAALRDDGVIPGLTLTGPDQAEVLRAALAVTLDGVGVFGCVQATWNLCEPSAGAALAEAHDAGWGVIVKEGVANGRLTARGGTATAALRTVAAEAEVAPDALALAAVLAQPWADVVLSGAATVTQVTSNLTATDVAVEVVHDPRLAALRTDPTAYWAERSALAWT